MANEIQYNVSLQAAKNGAQVIKSVSNVLTMAGDDMVQITQTVATSAAALTFGAITGAPSKLLIVNLDATNFIELASDSGMVNGQDKILPGDFVLRSPKSATIYAKADTAACKVLIVAVEA